MAEEAANLLRLSTPSLVATYFIGSLPFVLGFLYFWADMSRSPTASSACGGAAFGMAFLYIWMKWWHAAFARGLLLRLTGEQPPRWTVRRVMNLLAIQGLAQPVGLFALPVAALITVPFGWTYAFFENLSILGADGDGPKAVAERAWRQARLWPGQNHLLLSLLFLFGLFVFLNVAIALAALPHLVRSLMGFEMPLLSGPWFATNTTFLAVSAGIAWLCVDPVLKAAYVLRCFHGDSVRSGADLKAELKSFLRGGATTAAILIALAAAAPSSAYSEDTPAGRPITGSIVGNGAALSPEELDRAVGEVIRKREYTWRTRRDVSPKKESPEEKGFLASLVTSVGESLDYALRTIAKWVRNFARWWRETFPDRDAPEAKRGGGPDRLVVPQLLLYALLALVACLLAVGIARWRKSRRADSSVDGMAAAGAAPDLACEDLSPTRLPTSEWLDLASELGIKGELRLALRALFLAGLSHLARSGAISVARFKSNREYERELRRRAHDRAELVEAFTETVAVFERTWYGTHAVDGEVLGSFRKNLDRIIAHADE